MPRRLPFRTMLTVATAVLGAVALASPTIAVTPPTPDRGPSIETYAPYQPQNFCQPILRPGTAALERVLTSTYAGTTIVSDVRSCTSETGSSEHKDGRAIDWGVSIFNATQLAQGKAFVAWLLATDKYGNKFAMARRLGIMYVIWNKQIWGAWNQAWSPYSCSGITACHQDHMHISLDWAGAYQKTSYWSGVVTSYWPPPLPLYDSLTSPEGVTMYANSSAKRWTMWNVVGGHTYRITVKYTWKYSSLASAVADAQCVYYGGAWKSSLRLQATDVWQWTPTTDNGSGCNVLNHTYTATITPAQTEQLSFQIVDSIYSDNSGGLGVTIQRIA